MKLHSFSSVHTYIRYSVEETTGLGIAIYQRDCYTKQCISHIFKRYQSECFSSFDTLIYLIHTLKSCAISNGIVLLYDVLQTATNTVTYRAEREHNVDDDRGETHLT